MKNTFLGHEVMSAAETLAQKTAKLLQTNVDIEWVDGAHTASINQWGRMFLPDIKMTAKVPRAIFVRYCGFVVHELLHRKYTDFSVQGNTPYLRQLHNAVEDAWIEGKGIDAGLTGNIGGLLGELVDMMATEALAEVQDWTDPRQYPFAVAIYLRDHATVKVPVPANLLPALKAAQYDLMKASTSQDTLEIAKALLAAMQQQPEDGEGQPEDGEGKPGEGKGKGKADGEGDGQGQGEGQPGDGDGQGDGEGKGEGKPSEGQPGEGQPGEGEGEGQPEQPVAGQSRTPDEQDAGRAVEIKVQLPKGAGGQGGHYGISECCEPGEHVNDYYFFGGKYQINGRLALEVRRLFDNTDTDEWSRRTRRGAFDVAQAHAVSTSNNVFKRHIEEDGIKSACVIVIDASGSMRGSKMEQAKLSALALMDVLTKAGVEVMVTSFGDKTATLKGWNTSKAEGEKLIRRLGDAGGTNDFHAVRMAHLELIKRDVNRRVCMVLTDGDGDIQSTKRTVVEGGKMGITTIGIGIMHDVRAVYGKDKSVMVNDVKSLGTVALSKIKLAA